jgi:hypothetical protein
MRLSTEYHTLIKKLSCLYGKNEKIILAISYRCFLLFVIVVYDDGGDDDGSLTAINRITCIYLINTVAEIRILTNNGWFRIQHGASTVRSFSCVNVWR